MSVLINFDINVNFWETNPIFKIMGEFSNFYKSDTSKGKNVSSKVMWAVALFSDVDKNNKLKNFPEKDRKALISEDYIKDEKFKWNKYQYLVDFYRESQLTNAQRSLVFLRRKMEEREMFLDKTEYSIENAKELDTIMANTDKIYNVLNKLESDVDKELNSDGGTVRGGRTESASEKKSL